MSNGPMIGFRALDLMGAKGFLCGKILADIGVDREARRRPLAQHFSFLL